MNRRRIVFVVDRGYGVRAGRHRPRRPVRLGQRADPYHLADAADAVAEVLGAHA